MTADPDMPAASEPPEESGLMSDSTYEIINNTDNESQDGFPAESVCSSDYVQGDDVQSLVSTEYTGDDNDDEGHQSDASDSVVLPSQAQDADAEQSDDEAAGAHDTSTDSEDEQTRDEPLNIQSPQSPESEKARASAPEPPQMSLDDEESRESALQYAEESLETPSASIHETPAEREKRQAKLADLHRVLDRAMASACTFAGLLTLTFVLACTYYANLRLAAPYGRPDPVVPAPPAEVQTAVSTSTMIINYTSTKTVLVQETRTAEPSVATTETLLLPSQPHRATEKPGEGKGICSAEPYSPLEILIRMPHNTKLYWLAKDSISIELVRGEETIKAKFSSVDEGILIEVPKNEAHGVIHVSVITTRRPKVNETFAIDFGKPFVDEMMDIWGMVAEDLSSYYAIASAESARRAEQIRGTASEAMKTVEDSFNVASEEAKKTWSNLKDFGSAYFADSLPHAQLRVARAMEKWERHAREAEDGMKLSLLQAQIRAKAAWLRMRGNQKAHETFVSKAGGYLKEKVADVNLRRMQRDVEKQNARREWMTGYRKGYRKGRKKGCLPWGRKDCKDT